MSKYPTTEVSFEQYAMWARSRYPEFQSDNVTAHEAAVYSATEAPSSSEACPVTVRSTRDGFAVVTPRPKGSR